MNKAFNYKQGLVLYVLCIAQFTLSADIANLSISTATLVTVFDTDVATIQLLSTIQPLIGAALMLSASMLGLRIGWRKLLIAGSILGLTSTLGFLVVSSIDILTLFIRPLTGVASALILPSVLALVVAHCQGKQRALGFGLTAAATGFAAAIMPLVSGWLYDNVAWQWPFVIIAFCYFVTLLGAIFQIKPLHTQIKLKFDYLGALLAAFSIILIFIGILKMPDWGVILIRSENEPLVTLPFVSHFSPAFIALCVGAGLLLLLVFQQTQFQRKYGRSLLPIDWFKKPLCRQGFVILSLMYLTLGGCSFVIVTYLQVALSLSVSHSGGVILMFSGAMIALSILTPIAFRVLSSRQVCQLAFMAIASSALLLVYSSDAQEITLYFYLGMALLGSAMGMLASQCPVIITQALGSTEAEQSGGLQATLRNIGMVLGLTLFGGLNQHLMDNEVRHQASTSASSELNLKITNMASIPYLSDGQLEDIATDLSLSQRDHEEFKRIKAEARSYAFNGVMFVLLFIALFGLELSRRLDSNRGISCKIPVIARE